LRWSYGAMKGRPADWSAQLAGMPLSLVVPAVTAAGFDGIWLDPRGYVGQTDQIEAQLAQLTGQAPLLSADRDLLFYDLRPYARRLAQTHAASALAALRAAVLNPVRTACAGVGTVTLVNPGPGPRSGWLRVQFTGLATPTQVNVRSHVGAPASVTVGASAVLREHVTLPPGTSSLAFVGAEPAAVPWLTASAFVDDAFGPYTAGADTGTPLLSGLNPPECQAG
jgi:hypothetical protein